MLPLCKSKFSSLVQETYVSAILRVVLYSDDPVYWLDAYRKLNPITSPEGEIRFLQAAEALFLKGTCLPDLEMTEELMFVQAGRSDLTQKSKLPPSCRIIQPQVS